MRRLQFLTVVFALAGAACSDSNTVVAPTVPDPFTDRFGGTLNRNGGQSFSFTTGRSGNVQATLTSLAPDAALPVGLSLGTWNGTSCQIILANDKAIQGSTINGATTGAGSLCVRVYDVGNVTDPSTYEIQVIHF